MEGAPRGGAQRRFGGLRGLAIGGSAAIGATIAGGAGSVITASAHHIIGTTPSPATGTAGLTKLADQASVYADSTRHVVFFLWAPGTCGTEGAKAVFSDSEPVLTQGLADSTVTSKTAVPQLAGTYQWTAEIVVNSNGSIENGPTACGLEPVSVSKATPAITTTPSSADGAIVGTAITDSAAVTGGANPTGDVTFRLYGPSNPNCISGNDSSLTWLQSWTVALGPNGTASVPKPGYTTTSTGTFNWVAVYSGDADNSSVQSGCSKESVSVGPASPSIVTTASNGGPVGTQIHDTAQVSGGFKPTGTVTFKLFPPSDPTCANGDSGTGSVQSVTVALGADGSASSAGTPYTTTAVGTYNWIATYNGDANNNSASTKCGDEQVSSGKDATSISTKPSAGGTTGTAISDSATVSGGLNPTGTVTFKLFGPADQSCSGTPVFTSTVDLGASGTAQSGSFGGTTTAGTYQWVASYSGDDNNSGSTGNCGAEPVSITTPSGGVQGITTPGTGADLPIGAGIGLLLGGLGLSLGAELIRGLRRRA